MEDRTKKLPMQIGVLALVFLLFLSLDLTVYFFGIRRCLPDTSEGMQAKSVELTAYLPFAENTGAPRVDAEVHFDSAYPLPVLDCAAALYPVEAGIARSLYPEEAAEFDRGTGDYTEKSAIRMRNTRGAYRAIADGDADLLLCAAPSEEQLAYAAEKGVTLRLTPVGREAFVFLVNEKNPVSDLTEAQVKDIFAGKIRFWDQVGGAHRPISPVQRNKGSGSQTRMLKFMDGTPIAPDLFGPIGGTIGFSFRFYVSDLAAHSGVKMLSLNGVAPTAEHVADGSYPLVNPFYAVTRDGEENPNVEALLAFLLSEKGQELISLAGYAGIS